MRKLLPLSVCSLVALLGLLAFAGPDSVATASVRSVAVRSAAVRSAAVKAAAVKKAAIKAEKKEKS